MSREKAVVAASNSPRCIVDSRSAVNSVEFRVKRAALVAMYLAGTTAARTRCQGSRWMHIGHDHFLQLVVSREVVWKV
jgi:hypothetical protein